VKAEFRVIETRVIRTTSGAYIEYLGVLLVDNVPVHTKDPIVVKKEITTSQSELLDLLLQEEKGEI
jgi:hypothetical protein